MNFGSTALMRRKKKKIQNEVLQMYRPHIYSKSVVQCINMLIELNVQIVPYTSFRQLAKLENPSDSHDIVDKDDHCNLNMCYPSTNAINHISDYKTN